MGIVSWYVKAVQARHHNVWAVISVDFTKGPPCGLAVVDKLRTSEVPKVGVRHDFT